MMKVIVEGWRFIPHSYSIVNQFQCLEMLTHEDVTLYHRDLPFFGKAWSPVYGLMDEKAERRLKAISTPPDECIANVLFRIGFPYDFARSESEKTFVFGTSEYGVIKDHYLKGDVSAGQVLEALDVNIIVPSEWSKSGFLRAGTDPEAVRVIPHGVDTNVFREPDSLERRTLKKKLGWDRSFVFLNVSTLTRNKGIVILLKAFSEIAKDYPDSKLVLKGIESLYNSKQMLGDYLNNHLSDSERSLVVPRLQYMGGTYSFGYIACLYKAADCYVSPYLAEGFNLPALEAAACGLPVICTNGGPTDDFVGDEFSLKIKSEMREYSKNGNIDKILLIPDVRHLAVLMEEVIENSTWRDNARKTGPAFVGRKYTWRGVTKKLVDLFTESCQ